MRAQEPTGSEIACIWASNLRIVCLEEVDHLLVYAHSPYTWWVLMASIGSSARLLLVMIRRSRALED